MQPAPIEKKRSAYSILFALMVATGVVLLIAAAAWVFLFTKKSSDDGNTAPGAGLVLETDEAAPKTVTIQSQLGMSVSYNSRELAGYGFSDDVTYSANDLLEERPYSVIRLRPVETSQATRSEITLGSPELRITSSLDKDYWAQLADKKEYKELSKIDQIVMQTIDQRKANKNIEAGDVETITAGENEYKRVSFTNKDETLNVTSVQREDCYIAVEHDRPHVACINNIRASNFAVVPQLEEALMSMKYSAANSEVLIDEKDNAAKADKKMLDNKADEDVSDRKDEVMEQPDENQVESEKENGAAAAEDDSAYLKKSADFSAFLKAAPATVRVGAIYCADIKLTLPNGSAGPQLTGACVDKSGTGFFISNDGLLTAPASVVQVRPQDAIRSYIVDSPNTDQMYQRLDRVLGYLVEGRILMESDAESIRAGVQERNQDVIDKVNNLADLISLDDITIERETHSYALQLSDKPIVVNSRGDGGLSFAYSDSIIEAELVAKKYSTDKTHEQIQKGEVVEDDSALLKAKAEGAYPSLAFASTSNVSKGSSVHMIGYPMYAVGPLGTAQLRSSPMLRQGVADEVFNGAHSQRLLSLKGSSHAGMLGAPALNDAAQVIGVATYGNLNCPDGKCFAGTILRDVVDIRSLVRDRNLTLRPHGVVQDGWNSAVDELVRGNYRRASELFNTAASTYPQNYLATRYANYAKSQMGSERDTSNYNTWLGVSQIVVAISVVLLILLVIARLALKIFTRPRAQTQYGQMAGGQHIDASQWQQGSVQPQPNSSWQQSSTPAPYSNVPSQPQSGWSGAPYGQPPQPHSPSQTPPPGQSGPQPPVQ